MEVYIQPDEDDEYIVFFEAVRLTMGRIFAFIAATASVAAAKEMVDISTDGDMEIGERFSIDAHMRVRLRKGAVNDEIFGYLKQNIGAFAVFLAGLEDEILIPVGAFNTIAPIKAVASISARIDRKGTMSLSRLLVTDRIRPIQLVDAHQSIAIPIHPVAMADVMPAIDQTVVTKLEKYVHVNIQSMQNGMLAYVRQIVADADATKKRAYNDALQIALDAVGRITTSGWVVVNDGGTVYLKYPHRIYADTVLERDMKTVYSIPPDIRDVFYVEDIMVPIAKNIGSVSCRGFSPHKSRSNPAEMSDLCTGDLTGKPLTDVIKLPEMLRVIYLGSMFGNTPATLINIMRGDPDFYIKEENPHLPYVGGEVFARVEAHVGVFNRIYQNKIASSHPEGSVSEHPDTFTSEGEVFYT